jgi:PD-(D/E)XK nuclease superfamily/Predicted AAA-ATPase
MMNDLRDWYDGYRFTRNFKNHLFNPDMVLYFLMCYSISDTYPEKMLDTNVVSDYSKVANIFKIGGDEIGRLSLLDELVKDGYVDFSLTEIYNLESPFTQYDFLSLLFYMGMLTLREGRQVGWRFEVPNYVIKKLYFEYFTSLQVAHTRFAKEQKPIGDAVSALVSEGKPEPFFKIVQEVLKENHSNRDDMSYGEKHLQTLMIGLFYPYESYYIHSEYEARRGYPDIFLERVPDRPTKFDIVLEIKYVKKSAEDTLPDVVAEARKQLNRYMSSTRFNRPDVRGYYVVFLGGKLHEWREFGKY